MVLDRLGMGGLFLPRRLVGLGVLQPPCLAGPVAVYGLGPKLVAVLTELLEVDLRACDGPEPDIAGVVLQECVTGIDGADEHALPGPGDRVCAVGRAEPV